MSDKTTDMVHLAAELCVLASRPASQMEEARRLCGRLSRNPMDHGALCESVVHQAKYDGILADCLTSGDGLALLLLSIMSVSEVGGEDAWAAAHPDRADNAWHEEDPERFLAWRQRAAALIEECHQGWLFEVENANEFIQVLAKAGVGQETSEILADWLAAVRGIQQGGHDQ